MDCDNEEVQATKRMKNECEYCKVDIFIKVKKYMKSALAPVTNIEELQEEIEDKTGEMYIILPKKFCPVCGRKLGE